MIQKGRPTLSRIQSSHRLVPFGNYFCSRLPREIDPTSVRPILTINLSA